MSTTSNNLTYRTLIERIIADENLPSSKRDDVASGLRSFIKSVKLTVDTTIPPLPDLRKLISGFTPAMTNMTPGRWRNIRSHLQFALAHVGLATVPRRYETAPSPHWSELLARLDYGSQYKLSHIARYCTTRGIEPEQLNDEVMAKLLDDLSTRSMKAEPARVHRDAAIAWNKAAAQHPDWPQQLLSVADNRPHYSIPWEKFPVSLQADVERWLNRLAGRDFLNHMPRKPLRPASLKTRKRQLHEYLSALVHEGTPIENMVDLATAVTPALARAGMMHFWKRAGGKPSVHAGQVAGLVLSIARHYAKLDETALDDLRDLCRMIAVHQNGMTPRNKARLRPLNDTENLTALVSVPERLKDEVLRQGAPTRSLAIQMQTAVLIELLLLFPIRLKNLQHLRLDENLIFGRRRDDLTIAIPESDVKNELALEAHLPESTGRLFNLYLNSYRPLLDNPDSPWLFPGQHHDAPKNAETIRHQIKTALWIRCGLDFRPHTFRHAAGKIMLDQNPGCHGQVQRILGHKRLDTTMKFYTGMEGEAALAHYDAQIMRLRGDAVRRPRSRRGDASWM